MRWQYRCCVQGCHFAANGTFPLMWPAGVCLGRAVRRSQFRVLHDDRTVQQRCDTGAHHSSTTASPCLVVAAGVPTSVAGARDASGDDHAKRCGWPSPPAPLPRCGRGVIWFVNSVSLKTQERHCYAQLPPSSPCMRAAAGWGEGEGAPSPLPLPQRGRGRGGWGGR